MKPVRTFVALPAGECGDALGALIRRLDRGGAAVKWIAPDAAHLTLKFLGDVSLRDTAAICRAVQRVAAEQAPFVLRLTGVGAFPDLSRPRTLWVGASSEGDELLRLQAGVEAALNDLGYRPEPRCFTPHVTLGRVRKERPVDRLQELLADEAQCDCGELSVDEAVVYSSRLTPDGPQYEPLGRLPLDAAEDG